jgi:hypothetical protein
MEMDETSELERQRAELMAAIEGAKTLHSRRFFERRLAEVEERLNIEWSVAA